MTSQCNICSCALRGYISGEFSSVYRATRPRRQQRQEEQNPTEQNRRAENRRNNHDNDSRGEGSLWRRRPGTATRGCSNIFRRASWSSCRSFIWILTQRKMQRPCDHGSRSEEDATKSTTTHCLVVSNNISVMSAPRLASATKIGGSFTAFGFVPSLLAEKIITALSDDSSGNPICDWTNTQAKWVGIPGQKKTIQTRRFPWEDATSSSKKANTAGISSLL